jgi:glycopeptide antibiotics resistance protein
MKKLSNIFKVIFHISNIIVIFLYLFPGSILGLLFYGNLGKHPQLTDDFINISSNHFYTFFVLSIMGILSYLKHKKLNLLITYLLLLSVILELSHLLISQRSFELSDLFGNILGVVVTIIIYKIWKKYEFI